MISLLFFLNSLLGMVRRGVLRGSPWTRSVVGLSGPGVSVLGLPT